MAASGMESLREALEGDEDLRARFARASSEEKVVRLAADAGIDLRPGELSSHDQPTGSALASVSGGHAFPRTDCIYCNNPWTDEFCTLTC